jgi:hypothetical protein
MFESTGTSEKFKDVHYQEQVLCLSVKLCPWTGPEGSRRLRLPEFKTIVT